MNLTNTLSPHLYIYEKIKPFGLPVAILMLMVMMVIPLPSILLRYIFYYEHFIISSYINGFFTYF